MFVVYHCVEGYLPLSKLLKLKPYRSSKSRSILSPVWAFFKKLTRSVSWVMRFLRFLLLVYASLAYEMTCRLYIEGNTRQLLKYLESSPALNKISLFTIDNFAKAYNTAISDGVSIEMTKPLHCFICSLSFAIARDYYWPPQGSLLAIVTGCRVSKAKAASIYKRTSVNWSPCGGRGKGQ